MEKEERPDPQQRAVVGKLQRVNQVSKLLQQMASRKQTAMVKANSDGESKQPWHTDKSLHYAPIHASNSQRLGGELPASLRLEGT